MIYIYNSKNNIQMIGRLALSSRNLYKIPKNGKMVSARKCYVLSENADDILIQTNKEFSTQDIYVQFDNELKIVTEVFGTVGNNIDDLNIYHHLYTQTWMSKTKYMELWVNYGFDADFDIVDRVEYPFKVITVDPEGSIDLDDGFTFRSDFDYYYLDIHIADPISYFDFTKEQMPKIFDEFINRINTCYIPNLKGSSQAIHLLPELVVKHVSLLELTDEIGFRRGMSFCFKINRSTQEIEFNLVHTKLTNVVNKTYEKYDEEINKDVEQKTELVNLSNMLIKIGGFRLEKLNVDSNISHQMIEVFMIWVNLYAGNYLKNKSSKMITRVQDGSELPSNLDSIPKYCINFLNHSANYKLSEPEEISYHYSLGVNNYCHISSPMRRVIDMLNHLLIYNYNCEIIKNNVDLDKINNKMKIQKKISNAYDLICYLKNSNRFKAFVMELNVLETKTFALLIVNAEPDFKKMINVEIPKSVEGLVKHQEIDIEIYYNPVKFKSNKFPFDVKIL